ncbi:MAG TPA: lipoprotein insertase outer membrane protein LolB [Deltaproteobacteria bacterium]|nr:lipoprotein insertase outer membrane protein LolB [Deltaproteobacteria bacterium]
MHIFKLIMILVLTALLASCATQRAPVLNFKPDAVIETLSAGISMSMQTAEHGMAGNGYLVYRRPDQVHMILLSPFGTTLFQAYILGSKITLVYPAQGVAYAGQIDQLPDTAGTQGWRLMRWVMDADPVKTTVADGTFERASPAVGRETITVQNGLITEKSAPGGNQVYYGDYAVVGGVPLAALIEMRNSKDERIRLKIQEPEVNLPLDNAVMTPRLEGLRILPLSELEQK